MDALLHSRMTRGKTPMAIISNHQHSHWHMGAPSPYSFKKFILNLLMLTLCVALPVAVVQPKNIVKNVL